MGLLLLVILLLLLFGGGAWGVRSGYYSSAPGSYIGSLVFLVLLILLLVTFRRPLGPLW